MDPPSPICLANIAVDPLPVDAPTSNTVLMLGSSFSSRANDCPKVSASVISGATVDDWDP